MINTSSPRLTGNGRRREDPPPVRDLPGRWRRRVIGFGLLAETLVIPGVAVSTYLAGQALSGATAAELWPWIIALTIVVPAIAACQQLDIHYARKASIRSHEGIRQRLIELSPSHQVPDWVVTAAIPSLAVVGLYVIHPILGLALLPLFMLVSSVPRWLHTRARALGQEVRFETGITAGLIGVGLLVVAGLATWLVSRGELSAGGHLAAVVLTATAVLRASRPHTDAE